MATATNEVTGDLIKSKHSGSYADNFDRIFRSNKEVDIDCNTCKHHTQGQSIDDAPPICWDCLNNMRLSGVDLPQWEKQEMSDGLTEMTLGEKLKAAINKGQYDSINKPAHYTEGRRIEPIDVIEDWNLNFHLGNSLKYLSRAGRKDSKATDLRKACWYINRELEKNNGTV